MNLKPYGASPLDPTGLGFGALTLPLIAPWLGLALIALAAETAAEPQSVFGPPRSMTAQRPRSRRYV